MEHRNLSGSYREIGTAYGEDLRRRGFMLPGFTEGHRRISIASEKIVGRVFPEILEEIKGMSEGSGLAYPDLCARVLTHPLAGKPPGCTIFAVRDGGDVWVGRNYDWFYEIAPYVESYFTAPEGGYRSVGQSDMFVGREDGVNEKGLAVAMAGITSHFTPGVMFWVALRYLLDRCATVKEGVEGLLKVPHHCTITILLADKGGDVAVVEASPMKTRVRYPEGDFIASTNHLNHPDMLDIKIFEPSDSRRRYDAVVKDLSRGGTIDEKRLIGVLSDHSGLVCSHIDEMGLGTLWSTVTHINTLRMWRAEGHPCRVPYKLDTRLTPP
jgi:predicted choloylglycine hydrolase